MHALQKPELTLKEWQHPFVFISVIKEIFLKWLVLSKVSSYIVKSRPYSTGTILEKDAYFPSLMDRHTSRLIFCKMIRYTLYYLSPVVEFSHGAFFC